MKDLVVLEDGWGTFLVLLLLATIAALHASRSYPGTERQVVLAGFAAHVLGSIVRLEVTLYAYGGYGDALEYYRYGIVYAEGFSRLDFSSIDLEALWSGSLFGTEVVRILTGFVLAVIGPSLRGTTLVFTLIAFAGLLSFVRAFRAAAPEAPRSRAFTTWVVLWPSLCYWPSSIGKEALILLGLGLVTRGYAGAAGRRRWGLLAAGIVVLMSIRPHFGAMAGLAVGFAEFSQPTVRPRVWLVRALALLFVPLLLQRALGQFGLDTAGLEGVEGFVDMAADRTLQGDSQIASAEGILAVPAGVVNVLFRPFPWEAHNVLALISSAELVLLWALAWRRRHGALRVVHEWRQLPILRVGLPLGALLTVAFGLTFFNLGLLARQRVAILPFLFAVLEAYPTIRPALKGASASVRVPEAGVAVVPTPTGPTRV